MKQGPKLTRREALQLGGALGAAGMTSGTTMLSSPLQRLVATGHLSTLAANMLTNTFGVSPPDEARRHSRDRVSVHVPYEDDDEDAVEEWVDQNEDRDILSWNEPINTVTVIVPLSDVLRVRGTPSLADEQWRDGVVDLHIEVSIPEPVDLESDDVWSLPRRAGTLMRLWGGSPADSSGLAFDDPEGGPIQDAREVTGADDDLVDSVDTGGLTIAVVDTGFNHSGGSILGDTGRIHDQSRNTITDELVEDDGLEAIEDDGTLHGTHVTSTIAANPPDSEYSEYRGYCPDSDLLVMKALDDGSGTTADISRAITHAADAGADVMCLSLGSPLWSVELERALAYAVGEGCIPVVAAGNDGTTPNPFLNAPATAEYAIAVSACEVTDPEDARHAYFSSRSPAPGTLDASGGETADARVNITAPGMELDALVASRAGNSPESEAMSGTSMAAPCVVGGIGLLLADTTLDSDDFDDTFDRLTEYATPAPKQGVNEAGAGMLDVQRAIDEDDPDETQEDARDDEAMARDESWNALSNVYGRQPTSWLV